jgi:hypothetical protein
MLFQYPRGLVLAPLWPGYTFPISMRRSHFGSLATEIPPEPILDAYAHVIKVSASSFHNVSLTSVGTATVKGELGVVGFSVNFFKDCAAACGLCGFVGYNCSIEVLREQYGYLT